MHDDLTIIYYTANHVPGCFLENTKRQLLEAVGDTPIISVSHKPMELGDNICVGDIGRSAYNIYKQILIGAKAAKTKYVATAEDDVLYPKEHFEHRPEDGVFAYDVHKWSIYTWTQPPFFSYRERRTMTSLIVTRDALINALEERFAKYPDPNSIPERYWGEPGRYDKGLGVKPIPTEQYQAYVPSIVFSTEQALAFDNLGTRKRHPKVRATELPQWGSAEFILKLYTCTI